MQEQQQQQATTLEQKINLVQNITLLPSLTMIVFLRRKAGFRFLDLMKIHIMVLLLWVYAGFVSISAGAGDGTAISLFSLAVLIAAMIERRLRWNDIKHGRSWHTYSRGISWFNSILPLNETIVKRFIDPAAALIAGVALFFLFRSLAYYVILSAVCLFIFETIDYQRAIDRQLDIYDSLIDSEVQSQNAEYFQGGQPAGERPVEETAGISTGVSPDLAAAIERKRQRQQRQPMQKQGKPTASSPMQGSDSRGASSQLPYPPAPHYPPQQQTAPVPSVDLQPPSSFPLDNLVITDSSQPSPSQQTTPLHAATQAQGIQQQHGIPLIRSIDDPALAALPSGAPFMTPDGKTRWKK